MNETETVPPGTLAELGGYVPPQYHMSFTGALSALVSGRQVRRRGWLPDRHLVLRSGKVDRRWLDSQIGLDGEPGWPPLVAGVRANLFQVAESLPGNVCAEMPEIVDCHGFSTAAWSPSVVDLLANDWGLA